MENKLDFTDQEIQEIEELRQKYIDTKEKFENGEISVRQLKYRLTKINKKNEELKMFHELRLGIYSLVYAYKTGAISTKDYLNWKQKYLNYIDEQKGKSK